MPPPVEPLLPTESPRRLPLKLWLLIGGGVVVLGGIVTVALLVSSSGSPAPDPSTPAAPDRTGPAVAAKGGPSGEKTAAARRLEAEEKAAQESFSAAEAFDRAAGGDPEKVLAKYLEVYQKHPTTSWGRKAEQRYRQLKESADGSAEREFQSVQKDAQALAASGRFADAVETVRNYLKQQTKDAMRPRGEREIVSLENASREAFNAAARQTAAMAKNGEYAAAAALFEKLKAGAIPEVAARCEAAIGELREALKAADASDSAKQAEEAHRAFREGAAHKVLALLRTRRYEEGLKEFDAAAADPAAAPLRAELAPERAAIAHAAAFWEAFLKALRSRLNQEITIAVASPKETRVTGKLVRMDVDRAVLDTADGTAEVTFEKTHVDQIVAWTVGKTLPADDAATYIKAGMFFFLDGRDDLARLYLATAKEMGADLSELEKIFREGLLRAAAKK